MDLGSPGVDINMSSNEGKKILHATGDSFGRRCSATSASFQGEPSPLSKRDPRAGDRRWFVGADVSLRRGMAEALQCLLLQRGGESRFS